MTSVVRFVKETDLGSVFDEQATKAMGEAFDAACKVLDETGQSSVFTKPSPNASSKLRSRASVIRTS